MHRSHFAQFTIQNRNMHILLWIVHCGMWDRYMVGFVDFGLFRCHIRVWSFNIEISTSTWLSVYIGPINVGSIRINMPSIAITPRRDIGSRAEVKVYRWLFTGSLSASVPIFISIYINIYIKNDIYIPVPRVSIQVVKLPARVGSQYFSIRLMPIRFWRMGHGWMVSTLSDAVGGE